MNIVRIGVGVAAIVALVLGDEYSAGQHTELHLVLQAQWISILANT
jgi:hypothetical protein